MSTLLTFPSQPSTPNAPPLATVEIRSERTPADEAATIYVLSMANPPENRISTGHMDALNEALDHIEAQHIPDPEKESRPAALILTGGRGRFFSNGLQLAEAGDPSSGPVYMRKFYKFLARVLAFPMPTFAAVNGHAFAGGCVLAMCCDYRVMAQKRGWISMNALIMRAEPGLPLHLILKAKVPSISALRMMLLRAHRFTASDALTHGVVDDVCPDPKYEELIANAVELALGVAQVAKSGPYYGYMKQQMYREAYRKCLDYTDEEAETWTHGKGMYGRLAGDPRFSGNKL